MDVRATKGTGTKMKMQVDVFVIVAKTLGEVQRSIRKYIGKGYQLQGAVTPVYKDGEVSYLATMVKEV